MRAPIAGLPWKRACEREVGRIPRGSWSAATPRLPAGSSCPFWPEAQAGLLWLRGPLPARVHAGPWAGPGEAMTAVGFEPTPLRSGALSRRLRPLGQTVLPLLEKKPTFGICGLTYSICKEAPTGGLSPGPSVYKTDALPLSYRGGRLDDASGVECDGPSLSRAAP